MNFQFYVEKLFDSGEFQDFIKENADAYPCGGFFVIDRENMKNPDNKNHLDYFVPSTQKMFSFQLEEGAKLVPVENYGDKPRKIAMNYSFDFEDIEDLIRDKMKEEVVDKKIQKILLSLQKKDGKDYLIGTVFISGMGIVKANIDLSSMKVVEFSKSSFFDMINIMKKK